MRALLDMQEQGHAPDRATYNTAISACGQGGQWRSAMSLYDRMKKEGTAPNVVTFNALMHVCERSGRWRTALALVDTMRRCANPLFGALLWLLLLILLSVMEVLFWRRWSHCACKGWHFEGSCVCWFSRADECVSSRMLCPSFRLGPPGWGCPCWSN